MELVRIQKFLANQGLASRRKIEEYIINGKIEINGETITELGRKIDPEKDEIKIDGILLNRKYEEKKYILLNKPIGFVTTKQDQFQRDTVMDLVKDVKVNLNPVGRLDMYTSGALILTNDGDFIYKITHPKHEIEKTYIVIVKGIINTKEIEYLKNGVEIDGYITKKAKINILKIDYEHKITKLEIIIHEGRNRQVRKMCEKIGKHVLALHRSKIGNIDLKKLKIGNWRYLTEKEVESLIK